MTTAKTPAAVPTAGRVHRSDVRRAGQDRGATKSRSDPSLTDGPPGVEVTKISAEYYAGTNLPTEPAPPAPIDRTVLTIEMLGHGDIEKDGKKLPVVISMQRKQTRDLTLK